MIDRDTNEWEEQSTDLKLIFIQRNKPVNYPTEKIRKVVKTENVFNPDESTANCLSVTQSVQEAFTSGKVESVRDIQLYGDDGLALVRKERDKNKALSIPEIEQEMQRYGSGAHGLVYAYPKKEGLKYSPETEGHWFNVSYSERCGVNALDGQSRYLYPIEFLDEPKADYYFELRDIRLGLELKPLSQEQTYGEYLFDADLNLWKQQLHFHKKKYSVIVEPPRKFAESLVPSGVNGAYIYNEDSDVWFKLSKEQRIPSPPVFPKPSPSESQVKIGFGPVARDIDRKNFSEFPPLQFQNYPPEFKFDVAGDNEETFARYVNIANEMVKGIEGHTHGNGPSNVGGGYYGNILNEFRVSGRLISEQEALVHPASGYVRRPGNPYDDVDRLFGKWGMPNRPFIRKIYSAIEKGKNILKDADEFAWAMEPMIDYYLSMKDVIVDKNKDAELFSFLERQPSSSLGVDFSGRGALSLAPTKRTFELDNSAPQPQDVGIEAWPPGTKSITLTRYSPQLISVSPDGADAKPWTVHANARTSGNFTKLNELVPKNGYTFTSNKDFRFDDENNELPKVAQEHYRDLLDFRMHGLRPRDSSPIPITLGLAYHTCMAVYTHATTRAMYGGAHSKSLERTDDTRAELRLNVWNGSDFCKPSSGDVPHPQGIPFEFERVLIEADCLKYSHLSPWRPKDEDYPAQWRYAAGVAALKYTDRENHLHHVIFADESLPGGLLYGVWDENKIPVRASVEPIALYLSTKSQKVANEIGKIIDQGLKREDFLPEGPRVDAQFKVLPQYTAATANMVKKYQPIEQLVQGELLLAGREQHWVEVGPELANIGHVTITDVSMKPLPDPKNLATARYISFSGALETPYATYRTDYTPEAHEALLALAERPTKIVDMKSGLLAQDVTVQPSKAPESSTRVPAAQSVLSPTKAPTMQPVGASSHAANSSPDSPSSTPLPDVIEPLDQRTSEALRPTTPPPESTNTQAAAKTRKSGCWKAFLACIGRSKTPDANSQSRP